MKKCRRCNVEKSLDNFYRHKEMKDGHLNVCKECTKKRVRKYWADGRGYEYDKKRQQTDARRAWQREYSRKQRKKSKKKNRCRCKFWREFMKGTIKKLPCEVCGTEERVEAHHSDYDKPFDIIWLCSKHHKEWHRDNTPLNKT